MRKFPQIEKACGHCGKALLVSQNRIDAGRGKYCSRSCSRSALGRIHGHNAYNSPTYRTWQAMKARCNGQNSAKYPAYGAQGIKVCPRWDLFSNFLEDMGSRPDGKTIDRIDSNLGYFPENCRWATPLEQSRHIKSNRFIDFEGQNITLSEL